MIILHTICALVCFVTGFALLSTKKVKQHPWLYTLFVYSLLGMIIFMVSATYSHWSDLTIGERIAFSILPFLGLYMLYRAKLAMTNLTHNRPLKYINDIGFSLISLFNGFVIVALIDLSAPPLLIPVVAIVGTMLGIRYLNSVKRKQSDIGSEKF